MNFERNRPISKISWLNTLNGDGLAYNYYEPDSIYELKELCSKFFSEGLSFELIGHTSNTLFTPNYKCERMISTRKLNRFTINDDFIECECGTSVRQLALAAVSSGIKGFEGLIDLPGTVAAAVYGNAGCFGCSISSLLISAELLTSDLNVISVSPEWFCYKERSSALKRGEKIAIILSVKLRREAGNVSELKKVADINHATRKQTQPEARNSLGSIFANSGQPSKLYYLLKVITKPYCWLLRIMGFNDKDIKTKRRRLMFTLLNARDVEPYVRTWNWYEWSDENSHNLFWKYVRIHKQLFTRSDFEIEIKDNEGYKTPIS